MSVLYNPFNNVRQHCYLVVEQTVPNGKRLHMIELFPTDGTLDYHSNQNVTKRLMVCHFSNLKVSYYILIGNVSCHFPFAGG